MTCSPTIASITFDESRVRYIMADITAGAPADAYRAANTPDAAEALRRLAQGVIILNPKSFARVDVPGAGMMLVKAGTTEPMQGADVRLISDKPYQEANVRYIMTDMLLGGDPDYYRNYWDDPYSVQALRRIDRGITVLGMDRYARVAIDGGVAIVIAGTRHKVRGEDIVLSHDYSFRESRVRLILADLTLGAPLADYLRQTDDLDVIEAIDRWDFGVRVSNGHLFARHDGQVVYRYMNIPADGMRVRLNSDHDYDEAVVRYTLADIACGGPLEFHRTASDEGECNAVETIRRYDADVRVTNAQFFQRIVVDDCAHIVHKGVTTADRIDGMEVSLSSDPPYAEHYVRLGLVDIELRGNKAFYAEAAAHGDPNGAETLRRIDAGVKVMNAGLFERRYTTANGWQIFYAGTDRVINTTEVLLSSDWANFEGPVRAQIAYLCMGQPVEAVAARVHDPVAVEAVRRYQAAVRFINPYWFDKRDHADGGFTLYHKDTDRPMDGGWVRLSTDDFDEELIIRHCLVDMLFGGDVAFYRGASIALHSREAVRRYDAGVTLVNADQFEKITLPGGGTRMVYKGTEVAADPADYVLSTDPVYPEAGWRYLIADIALGGDLAALQGRTDAVAAQAVAMIASGVTVKNLAHFARKVYPGKGARVVYAGTDTTINGMDVSLPTDHAWSEGGVRFMMADIATGAPLSWYYGTAEDPTVAEVLRRYEAGVRVANPEAFERRKLFGLGWKIVYAGTATPIDGIDVRLTTD